MDLALKVMKTASLLVIGSALFLGPALLASDQPRGQLLELHSCELYAGGCTVSSESPLLGRQMVTVWQFSGGMLAGTDLTGLQVALLQSSSDNLASPRTEPGQAVIYLPTKSSEAQRSALVAWVKTQQPGLKVTQTRTVPLAFRSDKDGCAFSAGKYLSVRTAPLESCDNGNCGEALWYTPRSANSIFTVAFNRGSQVAEPALKLDWVDHGERSIFLAKFGEPTRQDVFVTTSDLCGPTGKLF
jgi:hypothetical protein